MSSSLRILRRGDDIGVPALVAESSDDLLSGYHLALLRPFRTTIGAYLALALQSKGVAYQFHVGANGVTRYGLTHTTIQSIRIPLPPLPEQRAIVRYLDHVDDRIRRYISAKEKLIALLEEERQAVIHRAVTRGLDPNVPLKPSGVEWLGRRPLRHWEVRRLKHLLIEPLKYGANEPAQYADPHLPGATSASPTFAKTERCETIASDRYPKKLQNTICLRLAIFCLHAVELLSEKLFNTRLAGGALLLPVISFALGLI